MKPLFRVFTSLLLLLFIPVICFSEVDIILKKDFVNTFKDKVTISCNYNIVKADARANPAASDGDMHIAGLSDDIALATVAEIMNAKFEQPAMDLVHKNEGTSNDVSVVGAWRLWCEHPGSSKELKQGGEIPAIISTNPDHVFEIHPITSIGGIDLLNSLMPIDGYTYKDADDAFTFYGKKTCKLKAVGNTTFLSRIYSCLEILHSDGIITTK